ncbi:MAG: hypothetical protein QNK26_08550 [Moritella sp.]|uniref:DUF6701 domain-containing protein n=1 Tax=Moritella sp. TaxID=78556 RepID=UPI0029A04DBE|nr:DUF6701 domain-containing protein [Moritella sp.]MDX2320633.1 hypothetical protein [Moritella sp.]
MKLKRIFTYSVFTQRLVMLFTLLVITLGMSVEAQAKKGKDFELIGKIEIGDSDDSAIHPRFMLTADGTDNDGLLENPMPVNPIHFHLSEDIDLSKIELKDIDGADGRLYFVIWNSDGDVVVNARSYTNKNDDENHVHADHGHAHFEGKPLPEVPLTKGYYRLAIVGQCFNPGGQAKGWSDKCQTNSNWNYDDFEFKNIKLKTKSGTSKSVALIERRHIGDTSDSSGGYAGRWYPDEPTDEVNNGKKTDDYYKFKVEKGANLKHLIMYNYRDVNLGQTDVRFTLRGEGPDRTHTMNTEGQASGDYTWTFDPPLTKKGDYELEIKTHDVKGFLDFGPDHGLWGIITDNDDDISWDDIVITAELDTPPTPVVNHYRIMHPTNALTCESTSAIILACKNNSSSGSCDVAEVNDSVTVQVDGSDENVNLTNGTGTLSGIEKLSSGTLALSFPSGTQTYCNQATADQDSCGISFADIGLQFSQAINTDVDIANQVAGTEISSLYLRALESDGNGTCSVLATDNNDFNLGVECVSPGTCDNALAFNVGNIPLNNSGGETSVTLTNVATGVYQVNQPVYHNAGKIRLSASYVFDNGVEVRTLATDSESFAVRPDKFNIKASRYEGTARTDLTERSNGVLMHTHKAEQTFTFEIQAVNANGVVTTNYVPTTNNNIRIKLTRSMPVADDGFDGLFGYAENKTLLTSSVSLSDWIGMPNLPSFESGVYRFESSTYSEVGAIKVNVKDQNYYGEQFSVDQDFTDNSKGQEIGRFIPSYFTLVSSKVDNYVGARRSFQNGYDYEFPDQYPSYVAGTTVLQPKDKHIYQCRQWPNSGYCVQWSPGSNQYEPGIGSAWEMAWILLDSPDPGAVFTYMDQPELRFGYRLEAQNRLGFITHNYDGELNAEVTFSTEVDGLRNKSFSDRLKDFGSVWKDGVYESTSLLDTGNFARLASGPDGPIMNTLFGISIIDTDGVLLNNTDMLANTELPAAKTLSEQVSELRYGRWFIDDGSGPTGSAFPVTMKLQYYEPNKATGDGFILNVDDSKTTFDSTDATTSLGSLIANKGVFVSGLTNELMISSDNPGTAILEYINTPEWLMPADGEDPSANIEFGFFYGNDRVIYRRRLN